MSRTYTDSPEIRFTIPWDKFVFRGFVISVVIHALLLLLLPMFTIEVRQYEEVRTIPVELINFGLGDGTGRSAGNLTEKGRAAKGNEAKDPLADAAIATKSTAPKTSSATDPTQTTSLTPVKELPSEGANSQPNAGQTSIGKKDGELGGTGLAESGLGRGRGPGLGDIEWGGGGNRGVMNKVVPNYPPGAQPSQIRLKFWVSPEGRVTKIVPLQKGDPRLERAAMDALWRWTFTPLKENIVMEGVIPFTFKLN
jgi:protein TonB